MTSSIVNGAVVQFMEAKIELYEIIEVMSILCQDCLTADGVEVRDISTLMELMAKTIGSARCVVEFLRVMSSLPTFSLQNNRQASDENRNHCTPSSTPSTKVFSSVGSTSTPTLEKEVTNEVFLTPVSSPQQATARQLDQSLNFSYIPSPICQRVEVEEPPKPAEEVEVEELPAASVWTGWRSEGSRVGGGEPGFAGGWRSSGEKSPGGAVEATGFPGAWRSSGEERSPGGGWRSTGYRQGLQDIKDRLEDTLETRDQDHSVSFQEGIGAVREKFENLSSSRIEDLPAAELGELIASLQKVEEDSIKTAKEELEANNVVGGRSRLEEELPNLVGGRAARSSLEDCGEEAISELVSDLDKSRLGEGSHETGSYGAGSHEAGLARLQERYRDFSGARLEALPCPALTDLLESLGRLEEESLGARREELVVAGEERRRREGVEEGGLGVCGPAVELEESVVIVEEISVKAEDPVVIVEKPVVKIENPVVIVEKPKVKVKELSVKVEEPVVKVELPEAVNSTLVAPLQPGSFPPAPPLSPIEAARRSPRRRSPRRSGGQEEVARSCLRGARGQGGPLRLGWQEAVTVTSFPRAQGWASMPKEGGCTLGMEARHCGTETTGLGGGEEVKQEVTVASVEARETSSTRLLQDTMDNPSYFDPPKKKSTRSSSRLSMASSLSTSSLSMTPSTSNASSAYFSASTSSLLHPSLLEEQEEPPSLFPPPASVKEEPPSFFPPPAPVNAVFPPPAPVKAKPTKKLTRQSVRLTAPPCVPELDEWRAVPTKPGVLKLSRVNSTPALPSAGDSMNTSDTSLSSNTSLSTNTSLSASFGSTSSSFSTSSGKGELGTRGMSKIGSRQRKQILKQAGVSADPLEGEELRKLRVSRARPNCGCNCVGACLPETCECVKAGILCHEEELGEPCSCSHNLCSNPEGRYRFDQSQVDMHFAEVKMGIVSLN